MDAAAADMRVAVVAIGRNEGERLIACLQSVRAATSGPVVYVDSGSTDASLAEATARGAATVSLEMAQPFTAARARNAGLGKLEEIAPDTVFVQLVDSDCALAPGWLSTATAFLLKHPDVAVVCGRRREKRPEASLYNRLCDIEWATPIGEALACGGDALMRRAAIDSVGGYREDLIAGEEPELCVRLREKGWRIWRLDAEMTLHDAAMTRFSQWWRRAERAGHAFAEVSHLHAKSPKRIWRAETRRALAWSAIAPIALALAISVSPLFLALLAVYPLQVLRLYARYRSEGPDAPARAILSVIGKFAEAKGALAFYLTLIGGRKRAIMEYK